MTVIATEPTRFNAVVKYEQESSVGICRDVVTVYEAGTKTYPVGTVLGKTFVATSVTPTAAAGNTGNGSIGTVTITGKAKRGTYTVTIIKAATNAGDFIVRDPSNNVVGYGTVAVAYSNELAFTLADGATDFVVGDSISVEVVGDYKYKMVEATATDGSNIARAIYISANDGSFGTSTIAATTDTSVIALVRGAAIVGKETLTYGASIDTAAEKTKLYSELESVGIICRTQIGSFPVVA
jgi:hypothetical protein